MGFLVRDRYLLSCTWKYQTHPLQNPNRAIKNRALLLVDSLFLNCTSSELEDSSKSSTCYHKRQCGQVCWTLTLLLRGPAPFPTILVQSTNMESVFGIVITVLGRYLILGAWTLRATLTSSGRKTRTLLRTLVWLSLETSGLRSW